MAKRKRKKRNQAPVRTKQRSTISREMVEALFGVEVPEAFNHDQIQEAINQSLWLAVSVYRLATAISNISFKVIRSDTKEEATGTKAKAIRRILQRPTLDDTYCDLIEMNMIHLGLAGETYLEKVRNGLGEVVELFTHNPKFVSPRPDRTGERRISHYVFRVGMEDKVVPAEEVIAMRVYNPNSQYRGMSMVSPMWQDVLGDQSAARFNKTTLDHGGRVSGVLSPKEGVGTIGDDEFKALEAAMRQRHEGPENAGRWMVLPSELSFQEASMTPKDMDFLALRKFSREIAAGGMGVPPMIVGNFDSATYANSNEQLRAFWDYVAKPWMKKLFGAFTEQWIRPEIDENLEITADLAQIDTLVDNQTARTNNTMRLLQGGAMTINEARKEVGLKPLPGGDRLLIPLNLTPADPTEELEAPEPKPSPAPPQPADSDESDDGDEETEREEALGIQLQKQVDRDVARAAHERQLLEAEGKLTRSVTQYLKGARNRILARLRAQGSEVDVDTVVGNKELESHMAMTELAPAILDTVRDAGELTLTRLGLDKRADGRFSRKAEMPERLEEIIEVLGAFDIENPRILAYLERFFLTHLEDLSARTLDSLRAELDAGLRVGEGVNQLVLRVQALPDFGPLRAERIARTETIGAFNLGAQEAFRTNGTPRKSWLVTPDERARQAHLDADAKYRAEPILVTDKFILSEPKRGSAEVAFPGDPEAPAWAVVNCRCAMLPEDEATLAVWIQRCKAELEEVYA